MLLKRKMRRAARACPHCSQVMRPDELKCGACGRLVRLQTAIPMRPPIDIVLSPGPGSTRHEW